MLNDYETRSSLARQRERELLAEAERERLARSVRESEQTSRKHRRGD